MKKAVILARVSTPKQEKEGLSLKDIQLPKLREYAKESGFLIVKEFVFQETADKKIRTKFNELLQFIKTRTDISAVISFRVDRMTRNFRDAVLIDDLMTIYGKEIHFVYDHLVINRDSVGRDIQDWDTKVYLAKQYINRLKEDQRNMALSKLQNGEWPQHAKFGYRNVTLENKRKSIVIDDFEAQVVRKMFEWYATSSYSMDLIKGKLKKVFNLDFHKGKIDSILKNKFYFGIMVYRGIEYPHKYETIISEELYDKVQEVKAGYNKKHHKYAGLPYYYRGLLRCSKCNCSITPEKHKGHVYYHCTQYKGKHNAEWLREEELTRQFSSVFRSIKLPDKKADEITQSVKKSHKSKSEFHATILNELKDEYQKYENRIERMYEDKLDGRITESEYDKKREEYRDKQKGITIKLNRLNIADEDYYITAEYIINLSKRAPELFESSKLEEKRQLINMTLQNLRLNGKNIEYSLVKPYDTILVCNKRHNWLLD